MCSNLRTTEIAAPTKRGSPRECYAAEKRTANLVGEKKLRFESKNRKFHSFVKF